MNPTTNTTQPQQQAINPSEPVPVSHEQKYETKPSHTGQSVHYVHDPIYVQPQYQQPVMMVPVDIDQDAAEASSAFTMAICFSILMTCFGCVCMSSIPFLFVWVMYRKSSSERAKRLSSLSMLTFFILLCMNIVFIIITICVVTIVPPVVIYT
ncbi:predicted protein [Naegleria gruberi]|uniref:Predicted protein n=1 Tax=Naegleria gruberi TaxID=5762 RepID=D2W0M4_NAEGR|nr:uncharacterized protein NAEGRDRAFT_74910 [Naegleria gruberi]EFC37315.1 predicted protein [Naegleria gruberi]|eukprot:XP_002670059.1 predicted protein [Naegleria gruberi strain NEG-M]